MFDQKLDTTAGEAVNLLNHKNNQRVTHCGELQQTILTKTKIENTHKNF